MYKISVPIAPESLSDKNLEADLNKYLTYFKEGKVDRVFVCVLSGIYNKEADKMIKSAKFKRTVEFFKQNGMEVGIWIGDFGHGSTLTHNSNDERRNAYRKITGAGGSSYEHGYCPTDELFVNDYLASVKELASYSPDIIMLDDDLRLNWRPNGFGCFCSEHLKEFYRLVGEEVPREEIEEKVLTGGRNKYRDAYMKMSHDTLIGFAEKVRAAVDEVNPDIRVGACMVFPTWDFEGTDGVEIAKAFAGKTKPFLRGFGAPYHQRQNLIMAIENERLQAHWTKKLDQNTEFFCEGDVYPRPRYNVTSKSLELFDLALYCDGSSDGILKYMFDYEHRLGYDTGYIEKHINGAEVKEKVKALFSGKRMTGVGVKGELHKARNCVCLEKYERGTLEKIIVMCRPHTSQMLSKNSIPTCYDESEYPLAVIGENARYVSKEELKNGAILDSRAALILKERGIDTGLVFLSKADGVGGEYFIEPDDTICGFGSCHIGKMVCNENAKVLSVTVPDGTPGAYTYENADGIRFLVLAGDFESDLNDDPNMGYSNYYNNYYRQKQLTDGIEYLCGKRLPAVCEKNPNLYILAAKGDGKMSMLMLNIFADDILSPIVTLDREYKEVTFVNCDGELKGDKLFLKTVPAYGFAAFEVKE